ncbi:DNA polymerase III delta prime subunit [Clostridium pascui]|uniref:FtsK/SpoIIIE domain-containing protein n=1 Tax=Clostridium pascui TaxID=46609 RepID=UPI00195E0660|nr:FtsK/SpoIIIE domain-containing protein [Clostridium pascui]MBM7869260.1 DNA polymerase III delta prime subunit [Clostridium pascui]
MFWQIGAYAVTSYALYRTVCRERIKFQKTLREICEKGTGFFNRQMETLKLDYFKVMDWGYNVKVGIPYGISYQELEDKKNLFKTNFKAIDIEMKKIESSSMMEMNVITKPLKELKYKAMYTEDGEILIGYSYKDYVKVNLNSFPHMLIGGDTGTGKSRLMLLILTNLINRFKDIEIYLIQIRKSDLAVFKDCKQVKYMARTLEQTRDILKHLDSICSKRDAALEKYLMQGVYNIQDYNKKFKKDKMKYIYIVLDEFAFFNPSGADTKEEKQIKKEILGYIKNIVLTGRSTGVFVFTSLQKPTSSSIPTDIKSQLTTRISFKMLDKETSVIVLGNANATGLKEREAIVRTIEEDKIKVPFIDHNLILSHIKASVEPNHKYIIPQIQNSCLKLPNINSKPSVISFNNKNTNGVPNDPKVQEKADEHHIEEAATESTKENGIIDLSKFKGIDNI